MPYGWGNSKWTNPKSQANSKTRTPNTKLVRGPWANILDQVFDFGFQIYFGFAILDFWIFTFDYLSESICIKRRGDFLGGLVNHFVFNQ